MTWPRHDLVTHRSAATPDRSAVVAVDDGQTLTYEELDGVVDGVAARLGDGGPVGVLLDTRIAFVVLLHAAMRRGRTLVPLNPTLGDETLVDQTRRADVDLLVCDGDSVDRARDLVDCEVASVDATENGTVRSVRPVGGRVEPATLDPTETALVMFTSGTTDEPKGVRLTPTNLVASAMASAFRLGVSRTDRWLCCLPMYHMGGLAPAIRCSLYGTSLAVQSTFDARKTAGAIADHDVTGVSLVPTQLHRLLDADWTPPDHLSTVLLGGAPAAESLLTRALDRGVPVYPTYGTTETASQIATATPAQTRESPGTVGQPLIGTDVTVLAGGKPVAAGERGELVVDGPTVTPGYLDEAATDAATSEFGLHTGDVGYRDENGHLRVVGRVDDAIVTGGETVHPSAVSAVLTDHPDVSDAAVVGVPDEEWGERVVALVVDDDVETERLQAAVGERLADHAVPKAIQVVEQLPRTASGTLDRGAVRAHFQAGTDTVQRSGGR